MTAVCTVTVIDICWERGDTYPFSFAVELEADDPINIAGRSYLLTVDPAADPINDTNNLFQLTGTITDAANGIVQFGMTALQADQTPATYYYDLQQTDGAGKIRTICKGEFKFVQDITK
jgi:hypothetical protein